MILSVSHIKKAFIEDVVIRDAAFHLEDREKAALVGNNGAGKTTLFRIIAGELSPDEGEISLSKGSTMGYLAQHADLVSDASLFDEVLSIRQHVADLEQEMRALEQEMNGKSGEALEVLVRKHSLLQEQFHEENGYALKSEVTGVLRGLGFPEESFRLPVSALSGGEKTRAALAKLLLIRPELLLLDEPTNHLDIHAATWLESYLLSYPGAVFIISHDRYFLDKVVTKVIDLDQGRTSVYRGNYTEFTKKKNEVWKVKLREYEKQQKEIRRQEEIIDRFYRYGTEDYIKKAKSREKLLSHVERLEKPTEENNEMRLRLVPKVQSGNEVMSIEGLRKSFDQKHLFSEASFEIRRGEHVALIGDNGTGKTTLFKIITGELLPDCGNVRFGTKVYIGYYDQEHQMLSNDKSIFDEIRDTWPDLTDTEIRNVLAAFLFTGDDVFKRIGDLSGGEKGRVSLAKIMLSDVNTLLLDEPTNHMDMTGKEILENALNSYEGTLFYISHDRYFINRTATRIIELYRGRFINYIGGYDYYLEKKDDFHRIFADEMLPDERSASGSAEWKKQKEEQAKKRKAENDLRRLEEEITALEKEIAALDREMSLPENAVSAEILTGLQKRKEEAEKALSPLYERWENMA